jgi:hypothetical protein
MTAEIAVLNKSAVALAADSAVTIGRPPNSKIYNTVNKIFELSAHHPVGVMVYGRLDFLGMPLETLVKLYRSRLGAKSFDNIKEYRDDFLSFLTQGVECLDRDQDESVALILLDLFSKCNKDIEDLILDDIRNRSKYLVSKENKIAQTHIRNQINILKSNTFAVGFNTKRFPEKHRTSISERTFFETK